MPTLNELAAKHGTDKGIVSTRRLYAKGYTHLYERYLSPLRNKSITLLEIGVQSGASLRMWEEYFPNARIVGIDVKSECKRHETDRTQVMIGDQTDREFLAHVKAATGPLDVVVDDGGHQMEQHRISLEELWPAVQPGGFYFIEDLHTCYLERYGGGLRVDASTVEYLKRLVDGINRGREAGSFLPGLSELHFSESLATLVRSSSRAGDQLGPSAFSRSSTVPRRSGDPARSRRERAVSLNAQVPLRLPILRRANSQKRFTVSVSFSLARW